MNASAIQTKSFDRIYDRRGFSVIEQAIGGAISACKLPPAAEAKKFLPNLIKYAVGTALSVPATYTMMWIVGIALNGAFN